MQYLSVKLVATGLLGIVIAGSSAWAGTADSGKQGDAEATSVDAGSTEGLLLSIENRLASLADRWEKNDLSASEVQILRRTLLRQLEQARILGGAGGKELETWIYLLEAQISLFPGSGPKRAPESFARGGGAIFGRVVDEVTQLGIEGARLRAYTADGFSAGSDYSGVDGYYSVGGLPPGVYRVTVSMSGYVGELWNDLICHYYCDPTVGQPIGVTNGTPGSGVDFELIVTGTMSGAYEDETTGDPLSGRVEVWSGTGNYLFDDYVYGDYTVFDIAPGIYFVASDNSEGLADELYDDIPCENGPPVGCDPTTGTPVAITSGGNTPGIDFRLPVSPEGRIAGSVADSVTGVLIPGYSVEVQAFDDKGFVVGYGSVNQGEYEISGLEPGDYKVWANSYGEYSSELWEEIPCEYPCDVSQGGPVTVVAEETTGGIDFTLDPPGSIEGLVTDDTGVPLFGVYVNAFGVDNGYDQTDLDGRFRIPGLMSNQDYRVVARSDFHRDELWEDMPCDPSCDTSLGSPVTVGPGQVTNGLAFSLTPSGSIVGTVSADVTGTLLESSALQLYDSAGQSIGNANTDGLGAYSIHDVGPGPHYLVASRYQFLAELFEQIDCQSGCDPTIGTPIAASPGGVTEVDFVLSRFGRIRGRVTSSLTGLPLQSCQIRADAASTGDYTFSDAGGYFEFSQLAAETYIMTAFDCQGLAGRLYDDVYCPGGNCNYAEATPVIVGLNELIEEIDFVLGPKVVFLDGFESGDLQVWSSSAP